MDVGRPPTEFEQRVFAATCRIPRGRVTTYGMLARELGCGSAQAVGQALKRNPFAPRVPCHRVIASDLKTGGFSGASGGEQIRRKLHLLEREGVAFDSGQLLDPGLVWDFR